MLFKKQCETLKSQSRKIEKRGLKSINGLRIHLSAFSFHEWAVKRSRAKEPKNGVYTAQEVFPLPPPPHCANGGQRSPRVSIREGRKIFLSLRQNRELQRCQNAERVRPSRRYILQSVHSFFSA